MRLIPSPEAKSFLLSTLQHRLRRANFVRVLSRGLALESSRFALGMRDRQCFSNRRVASFSGFGAANGTLEVCGVHIHSLRRRLPCSSLHNPNRENAMHGSNHLITGAIFSRSAGWVALRYWLLATARR